MNYFFSSRTLLIILFLTISFLINNQNAFSQATGCTSGSTPATLCTCPAGTEAAVMNYNNVAIPFRSIPNGGTDLGNSLIAGQVGFNASVQNVVTNIDVDIFKDDNYTALANTFTVGDEQIIYDIDDSNPFDSSYDTVINFESEVVGVQFTYFDIDNNDIITITAEDDSMAAVSFQYCPSNSTDTLTFTQLPGTTTPTCNAAAVTTQTFTGTGANSGTGENLGTLNISFADPVSQITISVSKGVNDGPDPFNGLGDINYCSPSFGSGASSVCSNGLPANAEGLALISVNVAGVPTVYSVDLDTGATNFIFQDDQAGAPGTINAMSADPVNEYVFYANADGDGFDAYNGTTGTIIRSCIDASTAIDICNDINTGCTISGEGATLQDEFLYFAVFSDGNDEIFRYTIPDPTSPCGPAPLSNFFKFVTTDFDLGDFVLDQGILYIADRLGAGSFRAFNFLDGLEVDTAPGAFDGQLGLSAEANTFAFITDGSGDAQLQEVDNNVGTAGFGNLIGTPVNIQSPFPSGTEVIDSSACVNPESSLPVTLSSFSSSNFGNGLQLDWSTSIETTNMGFNIYAYVDGKRVILNNLIIPSKAPNSTEPQYYEERVEVPKGVTQLSIASVDMKGYEEHHGPFEVGESYGEEPVVIKRDWKKIKEKYNQKMLGKGYEMKAGKMRTASKESSLVSSFVAKVSGSDKAVCNISVGSEGMYRLKERDLRNAGCDFRGEDVDDLALIYKGEPHSRRISNKGKVGNRTEIFFYAETPKEKDFLYTIENVYQVLLDPDLVKKHKDSKKPKNRELGGFDTSYMHTVDVEKNLSYDLTNPWGTDGKYQEIDPWYEDYIYVQSGKSKVKTFNIPVIGDVDTGSDAKLKVRLHAAAEFPSLEYDHEVELKLNSGASSTHMAKGSLNWYIEKDVPGSDLVGGVGTEEVNNQLEVKAYGDASVWGDFIGIDSYSLMYRRPALAINDLTTFMEPEGSAAAGYSISGYSTKKVKVYAEKDGQLYKLKTKKKNNGGIYTVSFKSLGEGARYWISPVSGFNQDMVVTKADEGDIKSASADVLLITNPALEGEHLDAYVNYIKGLHTVKVVNVFNIFDGFGYGMPTPEGIRNYLEYAKHNLGTKYVVIVGGTTNEYPDPATLESVQYVPTDYERTMELINFTPCDGCMADFNGDFVPDLPIFRVPSVEPEDTGIIATKSGKYSPATNVLLLAEENDGGNYGGQLNTVSSVLGGYGKTKIYLGEIASENGLTIQQAVCVAQYGADCEYCLDGMPCKTMQGMIGEINSGDNGMIIFNGHGGPTTWTFDPLMNVQMAGDLTNSNDPNIALPLACYTTYYHSIGIMSLAEQFLFNAEGGPLVISGPVALSELAQNGVFASLILEKMCDGKTTLAEAVFETKQENPELTEQVINWETIGNGFVTIDACENVLE